MSLDDVSWDIRSPGLCMCHGCVYIALDVWKSYLRGPMDMSLFILIIQGRISYRIEFIAPARRHILDWSADDLDMAGGGLRLPSRQAK